jgi:hypothetical protein
MVRINEIAKDFYALFFMPAAAEEKAAERRIIAFCNSIAD